jgi:hypothetical protein
VLDDAGTCADAEYCAIDTAACDADGGGSCAPRSEGCADLFASVCACAEITYGASCEAYRAGVSLAREAACEDLRSP